jgi:antitoxin MazE
MCFLIQTIMIDKNLETVYAVLSKWERQDYISRVRPSPTGIQTVEIPPGILQEMAIEPGAAVEWKRLEDGTINITIEPPTKYSLDDLVAGITPENRHEYIDTGNPVGQEVW